MIVIIKLKLVKFKETSVLRKDTLLFINSFLSNLDVFIPPKILHLFLFFFHLSWHFIQSFHVCKFLCFTLERSIEPNPTKLAY